MPTRPQCFVLPSGSERPGAAGQAVNFETLYADLISPAIVDAGLEPVRQEGVGGSQIDGMILCKYALVDLTGASSRCFYGLGLRRAFRHKETVFICAEGSKPGPLSSKDYTVTPYPLSAALHPDAAAGFRAALTARLREAIESTADFTLYQLVEDFPGIQRLKTDVFRDWVRYDESTKRMLTEARLKGVDAVRVVDRSLGDLNRVEAAVAIDLLLSYRAVGAWQDMTGLVARMPPVLAATVMVQEQLAFALNRAGRSEEAERILLDLIHRRGPNSETCSLLGRIYKDRWEAANRSSNSSTGALLDQAIAAYLQGFEVDWRDAYPGINAVTLMELRHPPDPRRIKLLPLVAYAVERRMASGVSDYWDHATRLELAVLGKDETAARSALAEALAAVRERWEPETTQRNLRLIRQAREKCGERLPWAESIEQSLLDKVRH